jgi:hypothetical protein
LREVRHRSHFEKPEAERGQLVRRRTVLVEARRQSDRIAETQPEAFKLPERRALQATRDQTPRALRLQGDGERVQRELVRRLRRETKQDGAHERAIEH